MSKNDIMIKDRLSLKPNYWDEFQFSDPDLEFIYNHLIEIETPQTTSELVDALVNERIRVEKSHLQNIQESKGSIYYPNQSYTQGQDLIFPQFSWLKGKVSSIREGNNFHIPPFSVITVVLENGDTKSFAASLSDHVLNTPVTYNYDDPLLDPGYVLKIFSNQLASQLSTSLESFPDLVRIAGRWFPRTLLVDVNIGFMNLAEALLDMNGGGPLPTAKILDQIELPTDANIKLSEFSLNLALQEDDRFDEVGPSGEVIWFLQRLEPEKVKSTPIFLQYRSVDFDHSTVVELMKTFDHQVIDEFEPNIIESDNKGPVTLPLIFPHWVVGSLPLSGNIINLFPTAYESPRVLFSFVDGDSGNKFPGWVARGARYVYGLENWYKTQGVFPGSNIHIEKGKAPGEVIIRSDKRRSTRDWVRTALVGADGGIVFAMVKQIVTTVFDERMAIYIPSPEAVIPLWTQGGQQKQTLEQIIFLFMKELAKLNPQGHVHGQELYAAVNILRRCPPGLILAKLIESGRVNYLGNLYFKLQDNRE